MKIFDEHAYGTIKPMRRSKKISASMFVDDSPGYDPRNIGIKTNRKAKSCSSSIDMGLGRRLKKETDKKPFWQIAPDGHTIERLYDPAEEPIDVETYLKERESSHEN